MFEFLCTCNSNFLDFCMSAIPFPSPWPEWRYFCIIFTCFCVFMVFLVSVVRAERLLRFQCLKRLQETVPPVRLEFVLRGLDRLFSGYVVKTSMLEL